MDRRPPKRAVRAALILEGCARALPCLVLLAGCGSAEKPAGRGAPPALVSLWDAHGGVMAWKRHSAVRFSYRAVLRPGGARLEIPRAALRLADTGRLWVRPAPTAEPIIIDLRSQPGAVASALSPFVVATGDLSEAEAMDLELAVRALPYLLALPLAASTGPWEFRTLTAPPDIPVPADIEVAPLGPAPVGGCVLFRDPSSGLLAKAVYGRSFPRAVREPLLLSLEAPVKVGGVTLFARRVHTEVVRKHRPDPVLFEEARHAPLPEPWRIEEDIGEIRFLDDAGREEECPLPETAPAPAPTAGASR